MNFGNKNYISYKQQDVVQLGGNLNNHKHVKQIITGDNNGSKNYRFKFDC